MMISCTCVFGPGVTRRSILDLALELGEFKVYERVITMPMIDKAQKEGRVSVKEGWWSTTLVNFGSTTVVVFNHMALCLLCVIAAA